MGGQSFSESERRVALRLARTPNVGPVTFAGLMARFGSAVAALEAVPASGPARRRRRPAQACPAPPRPIASSTPLPSSAAACMVCTEPDYPAGLCGARSAAAGSDRARPSDPAGARHGRHRRRAQRVGAGPQAGRHNLPPISARPVSSSFRAWRAASTPPRMKARSPPARARCWPAGSTSSIRRRTPGALRTHPRRRRGGLRNAAGPGAAGAPLPAPQPHHLRAGARRGDRRGGGRLGLAHHRELRARTGPRDFRRARLAARSARQGHQPADPRRRHADRKRRAMCWPCCAPILGQAFREPSADRTPPGGGPIGRIEAEADRIREPDRGTAGPAPVEIDELIRQSGASPAAVLTVLLELELAGRLARHPGNRVSQA